MTMTNVESKAETILGNEYYDEVEQSLNLIRPAMEADGGGVNLISVDGDGVVYVSLKGACLDCPSVDLTMQLGIKKHLSENISWFTDVKRI